MMKSDILSNQLKSVLFLEDITEGIPVRQSQGHTIQHFDYHFSRNRDHEGKAYGTSQTSLMNITTKVLSSDGYKELYRRLQSIELHPFSIVFNATYDEFRILEEYVDAMVVRGYIVEIEESFDAVDNNKQGMLLKLKVLLHSFDYLGTRMNRNYMVNQ